MRHIDRIFNNNVVSIVDDEGTEVILVGSGLGFGQHRGSRVDEARVEREFHLTGLVREGAFRVLLDVPTPVLVAVSRLSAEIRQRWGYEFAAGTEVALADHVAQAVEREKRGLPLANPLLWETRANYPDEYALAQRALDVIDEVLGVRLPEGELGFIAMHFVHAGIFSSSRRVLSHSAALRHILEIVRREFGADLPDGSPTTRRFLVHLKFVIERVASGREHGGELDPAFEALRDANPRAHACARRIARYLEREFTAAVTEEEVFYLMLHVVRAGESLNDASPQPSAVEEIR